MLCSVLDCARASHNVITACTHGSMRNQWQYSRRERKRSKKLCVFIRHDSREREYSSAHGKAINSSDIDVPFLLFRGKFHICSHTAQLSESSIVKKMQRRENGINLNTLSCTNVILVFFLRHLNLRMSSFKN